LFKYACITALDVICSYMSEKRYSSFFVPLLAAVFVIEAVRLMLTESERVLWADRMMSPLELSNNGVVRAMTLRL